MFTGYKGAARRLDDIDLPRIGAEIGVGEDELHAFMDAECAGEGFDAKGRVKMLFEPHVFYRELGAGPQRAKAVKDGLAYAKWKSRGYPVDSYPRLLAAMKINETAALRSASWGLGQIMGFNCEAAGYATPQDMIKAFAVDEENQLEAIVSFLRAKGLDDDLRAHDWATIERVYNGGGYRGVYAAKLAKAFAKWSRIKDTPLKPAKKDPPPAAVVKEEAKDLRIEPALAEPDDRLRIKPKPVLKSRKVLSTINGYITGGVTGVLGVFAGFEWRTALVIVGGLLFVGFIFFLMYRREIRAGMFQAQKRQ